MRAWRSGALNVSTAAPLYLLANHVTICRRAWRGSVSMAAAGISINGGMTAASSGEK